MIAGDDAIQTIYLFDSTGLPVAYASKAAMQAAGWDLTWYDEDGVALSSQPTWTLPVAGETTGRHQIRYVMPSGVWTAKVTVPSALASAAPVEFSDEGTSYDIDSVGSLIASSSGVSLTPVLTSDTAEIFDGDSIVLDFSVTEAALSYVGAASLAAVDTILCQVKLDSLNSDDTASVTGFTNSITSDTSGNRVVRCTLNAFPAALAVQDSTKSLAATAHLRLTEGSKTAIASEIKLTVKWKATTA